MATIADVKQSAVDRLAEVLSAADSKPTYTVDGQTVRWTEYRDQLLATIEKIDAIEKSGGTTSSDTFTGVVATCS